MTAMETYRLHRDNDGFVMSYHRDTPEVYVLNVDYTMMRHAASDNGQATATSVTVHVPLSELSPGFVTGTNCRPGLIVRGMDRWSESIKRISRSWVAAFSRHSFFFFQAEDGIRDYKVTGVQTCALPI